MHTTIIYIIGFMVRKRTRTHFAGSALDSFAPPQALAMNGGQDVCSGHFNHLSL
ncbi:MAG: hypothetical protein R6W74_05260 [Nitrosomonas halophila]